MSFSNNTAQHNPSAKWYEWNGEDGYLTSFDKSQKNSENKGKVKTDIPFKFILLDATSCIKGFSEEHGFIYSNEVKDTTTQPFYVKAHKGKMLASGIYNSIKGNLAVLKCRFNKNIYIVRIEEGDDLVQVVEEIKIDYLEGKLGKGRMLESKLAMNTLMKACRSVGFRVSEKVEGGSGTFVVVKVNKRPDLYYGDTLRGFIYTDSGRLFRSEGVYNTGSMVKNRVLLPDQLAMEYVGDQDTTDLVGLAKAIEDKTNYRTTNKTMDTIYMSAKSDRLEGRSRRRRLQDGTGWRN